MALIKCSECAKYVSDKNPTCSRCKTPIAKSNPVANKDKDNGSKWETAGLFMAATGAATFLIGGGFNTAGVVMTVSGLVVYGSGKFLIGKYI